MLMQIYKNFALNVTLLCFTMRILKNLCCKTNTEDRENLIGASKVRVNSIAPNDYCINDYTSQFRSVCNNVKFGQGLG